MIVGRALSLVSVFTFSLFSASSLVLAQAPTGTTVDLKLQIGAVKEMVTVRDATPLLRSDHHQVTGLISRQQIENLPLNGRNFLELAKLEPGVTTPFRTT